jgi:hypothetical protein
MSGTSPDVDVLVDVRLHLILGCFSREAGSNGVPSVLKEELNLSTMAEQLSEVAMEQSVCDILALLVKNGLDVGL